MFHIAAFDAKKTTICNTASAKKSPGPQCGFNRGYKKRLNKYHQFSLIPVLKAFANLSKLFFYYYFYFFYDILNILWKSTETIYRNGTLTIGVKWEKIASPKYFDQVTLK